MPTYTIDGEKPDESGQLKHLGGAPFPALPVSSMVPTPTPPEILAIKTDPNYTHEISPPPKPRGTMGPPLGTPDNYIIGVELSQRGYAYVKNGCEESTMLDVAILCIAATRRTPSELFAEVQLQYKKSVRPTEVLERAVLLARKGWITLHRNGKKGRQ